MDRRKQRRIAQRRQVAGFYLNVICGSIIILCLLAGGVQALGARKQAKAAADQAAADQAAQAEEDRRAAAEAEAVEKQKYDFTLSFMGDVNLDDDWATMEHLAEKPGGISEIIHPDLMGMMNGADLFCVNNEFAFTAGGEALDGKAYCFRSNPANVSIYQTMGVDLVSLANNHTYDYGAQGLTDTLSTLDGAGIAHVGAGENLTDASAPYYATIQGKTIAFVNASNAEINRYTPEATADSSGILLCYDHDKFLASVREADANSDYVVALVHWGQDYVYETSEDQRTLGHELIDAGADVIVGTHSHSVQGIEYYKNRPIFYSLGSCWFNGKSLETFLLQLHFTGGKEGGEVTATLVPAMQENAELRLAASAAEAKSITDLILKYSAGVWLESYADEGQNGHMVAVLHEGEAPAGAETVTADSEAPEGDADAGTADTEPDGTETASADTGAAADTGDAAPQDDAPAQG